MKYVRIQRSLGVDYLRPMLTDQLDINPSVFAEALKQYLIQLPQQVFIMAVFDGDEVAAFVIGLAEGESDYTLLLQIWVRNKPYTEPPKTIADNLIKRLAIWTEDIGRSEIHTEVKEGTLSSVGRWNFQKHATILSLKLMDGFEKELVFDDTVEVVEKSPADAKLEAKEGMDNQPAQVETQTQETKVEVSDGNEVKSEGHTDSNAAGDIQTAG